MAFTPEARRRILDELFRIEAEEARLLEGPDRLGNPHLRALRDRSSALTREYMYGLPQVPISRCPFCLEVTKIPIDIHGLDGPWWDYNRGTGRIPPRHCPHYFCYTGALQTRPPIEDPPFVIKPGPEVPFVIPRFFEAPGIRAVLASLPIGHHTGYPIVYFGNPVPTDLGGRVNEWGYSEYEVYEDGKPSGWNARDLVMEDLDYDLAPWIARGRLLYILPGDESLSLHSEVDACPYLDLPGHRAQTIIYKGVVRAPALEKREK